MSKIKISTLTPVHIGSGNFLQYNTDFVVTRKNTDSYLNIIDERKILELIGVVHLNDWVLSIERNEDTQELVKRYSPHSSVSDYILRCSISYSSIVPTDTLKECIHDGLGVPYIPGSSIKGAIRTALVATLSQEIIPSLLDKPNLKHLASDVEGKLFGKDPKEDVFRFLQVGDAYFDKGSEIVLRLIMGLNITQNKSLRPKKNDSKPQLVEAIGVDEEAIFSLKINMDYYLKASNISDKIGKMPDEMRTVPALFHLINKHTSTLLTQEIDFWEREGRDKIGMEDYVEKIKEMLDEVNKCEGDNQSCVLRVGHASGWRFITGAWSEQLPFFESFVMNAARPGNRNRYNDYPFPKSRRMDFDGDLMGFVKLSML
ncbi:type III-A CRISPR-associated RAMP protein Csm5 [Bacteroides sp. AN502(2024)]|uniref:type III-A CRISPR-associated RAMP protein Csm5 n=1 Tax=Bacteroides sp. AN502(2024) TaxID=3160599 RepID=UPI003517FCBE